MALGLQSVLKGFNIECSMTFQSDASAAVAISNRRGHGKVRHIEVCQLWLQDKVSQKVFSINKVGTDDNLADALTKGVDATAIQKHLEGVRVELRCDRHQLAPTLEAKSDGAEYKLDGE